jgi:hypothetical protein
VVFQELDITKPDMFSRSPSHLGPRELEQTFATKVPFYSIFGHCWYLVEFTLRLQTLLSLFTSFVAPSFPSIFFLPFYLIVLLPLCHQISSHHSKVELLIGISEQAVKHFILIPKSWWTTDTSWWRITIIYTIQWNLDNWVGWPRIEVLVWITLAQVAG